MKKEKIMRGLHDDVGLNKLHFKNEDPTKNTDFKEYYDFKELFKGIKSPNIKFDDTVKKSC